MWKCVSFEGHILLVVILFSSGFCTSGFRSLGLVSNLLACSSLHCTGACVGNGIVGSNIGLEWRWRRTKQ
jgi:hypothetical protein